MHLAANTAALALSLGLGLSSLLTLNTVVGPQVLGADAPDGAPLRFALARHAVDSEPRPAAAQPTRDAVARPAGPSVAAPATRVAADLSAAPAASEVADDAPDDAPDDEGTAPADGATPPDDAIVNFAPRRATLDRRARAQLDDVVRRLESDGRLSVEVRGHADQRGRSSYNLRLSRRRAERVAAYMRDQGVATARVEALGLGDTEPLDDGDDEGAWRKNRRVEIEWSAP